MKRGGSLLLVLDEEKHQRLATTGVNDLIAPFGLQLTGDTPFVPNPGAIALAGEINKANREIPYDGGRAVEGGTPFAFQLDLQSKPAQPYGAFKKVDSGGSDCSTGRRYGQSVHGIAKGKTPHPTAVLEQREGRWQIVHRHSSAPRRAPAAVVSTKNPR